MSQYTELVTDILAWTNRPDLTAEMNLGIKNAIRAAHRAGKLVRDLVTVQVPLELAQIQSIDLTAAPFTKVRQVLTVKPTDVDREYTGVDVLDLYDVDGYARTNIFYQIGTTLHIRADVPVELVDINYWQQPTIPTDLTTLNDWIVEEYSDLIVLWAAATVLAAAGEQEVKTRVEGLAKIAYDDFIADNLQTVGR